MTPASECCFDQNVKIKRKSGNRRTVALNKLLSKYVCNIRQCLVIVLFAMILPNYNVWQVAVSAQRQSSRTWKTGDWWECHSDACGAGGSQLRSVTCYVKALNISIPKYNCDQASKPLDKRACFKVCEYHKDIFEWWTGTWGACMGEKSCEDDDPSCGGVLSGVQTRAVDCVNATNATNVVNDYVCLKFFPHPGSRRACSLPPPVDCVASTFGAWSGCPRDCVEGAMQIRTRSVLRSASYGGRKCPDMLDSRPCPELQSCVTDSANHRLKIGEWSECGAASVNVRSFLNGNVTEKNQRRRLARIVEGLVGSRARPVSCLDHLGRQLGKSIEVAETCSVTSHCAVSDWSEWGDCSASCGEKGKRTRSRDIVRLPQGGDAKPCPVTMETQSCLAPLDRLAPCLRYWWVAGGWGRCTPFHNATCGGGTRSRQVYCSLNDDIIDDQVSPLNEVVAPGASDPIVAWQPVDERNCNESLRPAEWHKCDLECPRKCDVSQWSGWSRCAPKWCPGDPPTSKPGKSRQRGRAGFMRRERKIHNAFGAPENCDHTLEVAPCDDARCFSWHITASLPCQPRRGTCGRGTMARRQECQDMWRRPVGDEMCRDVTPMPHDKPCHLACPTDCVVSEWGAWTPCAYTCRPEKRIGIRQSRSRFIVAPRGPSGAPCPPPDDLVQSRRCKPHKCSVYYWNKFPWGSCEIAPSTTRGRGGGPNDGAEGNSRWRTKSSRPHLGEWQSRGGQFCRRGVQTRRVVCKKKKNGRTSRKNCLIWDKPSPSRGCFTECRKDCLVSLWSEWTSCGEECDRSKATRRNDVIATFQQRRRYVIHEATGQGEQCPEELNQTRPCLGGGQCGIYEWRMSKWSPCLLAVGIVTALEDDGKCVGVKTRVVTCDYVTINDSKEAVKHDHCLEVGRRPPRATRSCLAKCPPNFSFSEWKQRHNCQGELDPPSQLRPQEGTSLSTPIPVNPIGRPIGSWSSCFTDPTILSGSANECVVPQPGGPLPMPDAPSCGSGRRRRTLGCFEEGSGIVVGISFCGYRAYDEEDCQVPCPVGCEMSEWSEWGDCGAPDRPASSLGSLPCGESLRVRSRHMIGRPAHGGRPCPPLDDLLQEHERRICHRNCDEYFWVATNRSACVAQGFTNGQPCGEGRQQQDAVCFKAFLSSGLPHLAQPAEDMALCDPDQKPFTSRPCHAPCPGACVLSEWGALKGCGDCTGEAGEKDRRILRRPSPDSSCAGQLTETEACLLGRNCFIYSWGWTPWSGCLLPEGAQCGQGRKRRGANCLRSDGVSVSTARCVANNVTVPTSQSVDCQVDCPVDCKVSDWSEWSSCSASCGLSRVRSRMRKVIRSAGGLGRPCSEKLTQHLPCCAKPCYAWRQLGWGECKFAGRNCWEGVQEMEVACLQEGVVVVSDSLCRLEQQRQGGFHELQPSGSLFRTCQLLCPGECRFTEWSAWGECHGECNYVTMVGTRSRSRVRYAGTVRNDSCHGYEVEDSQCNDPTCFTYTWKTSDFVGRKRDVWCTRDPDDVIVASGCKERDKPDEEMRSSGCQQNCDAIKHGHCSPTGRRCDCAPPLVPHYNVDEELLECVDPDGDPPATVRAQTIVVASSISTKVMMRPVEATMGTNERPPNATTPHVSSWPMFNPFDSDGSLKGWAYGAMAGILVLLVVIVAISYFICTAYRRGRGKPPRRFKGGNSNMGLGMVVASSGGSYAYGPGDNGLPPYYMNTSTPPPRYTQGRNVAQTSSASTANSCSDWAAADNHRHYDV